MVSFSYLHLLLDVATSRMHAAQESLCSQKTSTGWHTMQHLSILRSGAMERGPLLNGKLQSQHAVSMLLSPMSAALTMSPCAQCPSCHLLTGSADAGRWSFMTSCKTLWGVASPRCAGTLVSIQDNHIMFLVTSLAVWSAVDLRVWSVVDQHSPAHRTCERGRPRAHPCSLRREPRVADIHGAARHPAERRGAGAAYRHPAGLEVRQVPGDSV